MCVRVLHAVAAMLAAATLTSGCGVRPTGTPAVVRGAGGGAAR